MLLAAMPLMLTGCGGDGGGADESTPMSEIKAEAEKMDTSQLRAKAEEYKKALTAKQEQVQKLAQELKDLSPSEMLGEKAKSVQADIEELNDSLSNLTARLKVYTDKLAEKGEDVTGLAP